MHYLFYITKYIHVIHTLASHLRNKQGNWGQSGVDVLRPAGYAVCDGNVSSFLCVFQALLSQFLALLAHIVAKFLLTFTNTQQMYLELIDN